MKSPRRLFLAILAVSGISLAQSRSGVLVGRVIRVDGTPAANVLVAAFPLPDAKGLSPVEPITSVSTDSDGRYRLAKLPSGRYAVIVNVAYVGYNNAHEVDSAPVVTVQPGTEVRHDISIKPEPHGVIVRGRVRQEPTVRKTRFVSLSSADRSLRTNVRSDGAFVFASVPTYSTTP